MTSSRTPSLWNQISRTRDWKQLLNAGLCRNTFRQVKFQSAAKVGIRRASFKARIAQNLNIKIKTYGNSTNVKNLSNIAFYIPMRMFFGHIHRGISQKRSGNTLQGVTWPVCHKQKNCTLFLAGCENVFSSQVFKVKNSIYSWHTQVLF